MFRLEGSIYVGENKKNPPILYRKCYVFWLCSLQINGAQRPCSEPRRTCPRWPRRRQEQTGSSCGRKRRAPWCATWRSWPLVSSKGTCGWEPLALWPACRTLTYAYAQKTACPTCLHLLLAVLWAMQLEASVKYGLLSLQRELWAIRLFSLV